MSARGFAASERRGRAVSGGYLGGGHHPSSIVGDGRCRRQPSLFVECDSHKRLIS